MYKKGFTLSEVMVTMGILGVLSAILIPVIMHTAPDANKVMFKKSYYTLERTVNLLINDDINYPAEQTVTSGSIDYPRGFNYLVETVNNGQAKFCYLVADTLNTVDAVTCSSRTSSGLVGSFKTSDGISWSVYVPYSDSATVSAPSASQFTNAVQFPVNSSLFSTKIILDVNGDKKPNCTLDTVGQPGSPGYIVDYGLNYDENCKNPDQFVIGVRYDGKLQVGKSIVGATTTTDSNAIRILSAPTSNLKDS